MVEQSPSDQDVCGLCGQPLKTHDSEFHGEPDASRIVKYVVVALRGMLADYVATDDPSDKGVMPISALALNLELDPTEVTGRHFTCRVVRDDYGITRSDFRLA